jgi:hypothetical protein
MNSQLMTVMERGRWFIRGYSADPSGLDSTFA